MSTHYIKSYNNYFKLIDETTEIITLVSSSVMDVSGSTNTTISMTTLSGSVKYDGIRDSFISSSETGSNAPQIINQSVWEEKRDEIKNYFIENL
jgi:hypothetical protein